MPRARQPLDAILDPVARGLTGAASRSAPEPEPDQTALLDHIAEVSKNARATWFALIGLCLFVGVTLLGHEDADFFAFGAETKLPLVNVEIPVTSFFVFAPVLVAALYIYLHLYLISLWDALADLEQKKGAAPIADRVYPWLISHAALWYRSRKREDRSAAPRALGWVVVGVSLLLGWLFGLAVLAGLWFRSLPAHEEWLTLWIAACLLAATAVGYTGLRTVRARMQNQPREKVAEGRVSRRFILAALLVLLAFLSWEKTEGGILVYTKTGAQVVPLSPADLREADLTRKPPGWLPWHLWREDFEEKYRKRQGIELGPELTDAQKPAFEREAKERYGEYIAQLAAPDLADADLRFANMFRAFLPGADFGGAQMQGADLGEAEMQGADLSGAEMQGADLSLAQMQGADLRGAEMQGAVLRGAQMQGADLSWAKLQRADLIRAEMQGADLSGAEMRGADLTDAQMQGAHLDSAQMQGAQLFGAQMQGADLNWAQMRGAYLSRAHFQGANLFGVQMQGADLDWAQMQGADLSGAEMQNASCIETTLRGVLVQTATAAGVSLKDATITCNHLMQWQLEKVVGDLKTVLPEGLTVASCLATLPEDVEAALAHHPEEGDPFRRSRAQIRDALLCDRDADGKLTEQPHRVGRHPSPEQ